MIVIKNLNICLQVDFNPLKLIFLRFFLDVHVQKWMIVMFIKKSGQKVDIKPSNVCQEIFGNENQTVFFKLNFNPLELTFVRFFGVCLCKMEWSSIFKKSGPKICFLPLKLALRVEHSYTAHSPISTLFHTVRKRLTTDLPTWRKLSYLHKEFCYVTRGCGGTDTATILPSLNLLKYPLRTEICRNDDIKKHLCNAIKTEPWG
jgi:hypothetical protein